MGERLRFCEAGTVHRRRTGIVAATAALFALPVVLGPSGPADAAPRTAAQAEAEAQKARAREQVLTGDISAYSAKIRTVEGRLAPIQARLTALEAELSALRTKRQKLTSELEAEQRRLTALVKKLTEQRSALASRLSAQYRRGDTSMLQVLLQSGSLSTAFDAQESLKRVVTKDRRLIVDTKASADESKRTRDSIKVKRAEVWRTEKKVATAEAEVQVTFDRVNAERVNLVAARAARSRLLASIRVDRRELEKEATNLRARSAALSRTISSASVSLPSTVPVGGSGRFSWPVSGPVVSPFGPRWGRMHEGIDIAAGTGRPIGASADGTVIVAGWTGGYGQLVVVSHGTLSTAYAHMSRISVSNGQRVSRGQVLGAVGCTGHCFGPHVHFEVRVNGAAVNPIPYM